ncbi:MAG: xanthine dehydrogenase molybdopterin binding subunit [Xanthomonadales bacterium]|nr:xanthine dehydrogenase molybdopterin binding subunit [Xanthomonadales bacterium]NNL94068.1 xanthine dehydrogenase molybdopterin binding subunit [Xanthomonadales bacterium]
MYRSAECRRLRVSDSARDKAVHRAVAHDSAAKHVQGTAMYVDDIPEPRNLLHAYFGTSTVAHGRIKRLDLDRVRAAEGVKAVITSADIRGQDDISPVHAADEGVFANDHVQFYGQPLFAVAASSRDLARRAVRLAGIEYEPEPAIVDIDAALDAGLFVSEAHVMSRGDAEDAICNSPASVEGVLRTGGQDHFYLEGQVSMVIPVEDGDLQVYTSSQHPSEVQQTIARVLDKPANAVTVEVRRMGGAFGGKETQAAQWAVIAALLAEQTGRPVKLRLDRDDDMQSTGKRHDFIIRYQAGFDDQGRINGIRFFHAARCGMSSDLSAPIADRAMFHADNAYYLPAAHIESHRCKTHTVSNTAFRGFGGPQGMMGIERVIDEIAQHLGTDPWQVRRANFYAEAPRNITPYFMEVQDSVLDELCSQLADESGYTARRTDVMAFNESNEIHKRGIALTPVKFGISFTTTFLNQAGALVHVYKDGSIHLNHGGTEMGQGLMTKVAQVVADEFGVPLAQVKITATTTAKVPNTTATAASAGSDMNGMAARAACRTIRERITDFLVDEQDVSRSDIHFEQGMVRYGPQSEAFAAIIERVWMARISLSATGFYKTPKIHYDREQARGRPFFYFAYGAAVSEVEIDTLTGENRILRVDILHDTGQSLNPAVDMGQIEGGFVQGAGWLTSEELWWDEKGQLRTHAPSTYKIPTCGDVPEEFHARIWQQGCNREETIHKSKAVGEPPLMLAISVFSALGQAVVAAGGDLSSLDAPATPERILNAIAAGRRD